MTSPSEESGLKRRKRLSRERFAPENSLFSFIYKGRACPDPVMRLSFQQQRFRIFEQFFHRDQETHGFASVHDPVVVR